MKSVYHIPGDTLKVFFSLRLAAQPPLAEGLKTRGGGWGEEDHAARGFVSTSYSNSGYFLVQSLKIERKEVLIIPPRCLLQNFTGGDSLGFRNASPRRKGWQFSTKPKLLRGWLLLTLQSFRVSHFLSRDQTLLSQCSTISLPNEMEKC